MPSSDKDKLNFHQHISQCFNADLEALKTELMAMGGLVEQQIIESVTAIIDADDDVADRVLSREDSVDTMEVSIDEHCTSVLALRQPTASDLRMVLAVSRITRDLERMGDEASKVAKIALQLNDSGRQTAKGYSELRNIGVTVHSMTGKAMDAFNHFDTELALEVVRKDKLVDEEYGVTIRTLVTYMMEDPRSISKSMNIIWALRALERIGDHARNIAEHVVYLVKGKDVRHAEYQDIENQVR